MSCPKVQGCKFSHCIAALDNSDKMNSTESPDKRENKASKYGFLVSLNEDKYATSYVMIVI